MMTLAQIKKLKDYALIVFINHNECVYSIQFIELAGSYLNLQTISYYAKSNNMSYNGVKKCRLVTEIFGTKYVIDNE